MFPLGCGVMLDICTVWLFPQGSFRSRAAFLMFAPLTSAFYHWVLGTMFMFVPFDERCNVVYVLTLIRAGTNLQSCSRDVDPSCDQAPCGSSRTHKTRTSIRFVTFLNARHLSKSANYCLVLSCTVWWSFAALRPCPVFCVSSAERSCRSVGMSGKTFVISV